MSLLFPITLVPRSVVQLGGTEGGIEGGFRRIALFSHKLVTVANLYLEIHI